MWSNRWVACRKRKLAPAGHSSQHACDQLPEKRCSDQRRSFGATLAEPGSMTITLTGLLVLLIVAGICGAVGRAIAGGPRGGIIVSIAVGFVGALLGMFIAGRFGLPELMMISVDGHRFPILWSIIGASLFVAIVHLISGGGYRGNWRYR